MASLDVADIAPAERRKRPAPRGGPACTYLNVERLDAVDAAAFRARKPFPWVNPEGLLTDEGYRCLREALPDASRLAPVFGVARAHGQQSHDRFALEYHDGLDVPEPWRAFVRELRGAAYRRFLRRMIGRGLLRLSFHWHYTPSGCSVSPHCDNRRKLGSHIFYFNTAADWDPAWGGETLILDDGGRFHRRSAPAFEDFEDVTAAEMLGNRSLLFARGARSWHGMREIRCPEGALRKVFIVVIDDWVRAVPGGVVRRLRGKRPSSY
jgi:hypothetical protein